MVEVEEVKASFQTNNNHGADEISIESSFKLIGVNKYKFGNEEYPLKTYEGSALKRFKDVGSQPACSIKLHLKLKEVLRNVVAEEFISDVKVQHPEI